MKKARARRKSPTAAENPVPVGLGGDDKRCLVETALELIEKLYVHLPLKRSMYAVNPAQRLRLLLRRLAVSSLSDRQFYDELLSVFSQLRDLHTAFVLPEPFRSTTAYLPFRLEACMSRGRRMYVVTHVMDEGRRDVSFRRGVIVTHWNGVPIDRAVALNADRESGSNAAARQAQGLAAMTIRWLGQSLPPDEEWVDVRYMPHSTAGTAPSETRFQWRVFRQQLGDREHAVARASGRGQWSLGLDVRGEVERQIRGFLFSGQRQKGPASRVFGYDEGVSSRMPDVFPSCRDVVTKAGTFAYVRIATFNVALDRDFLKEFIRIVGRLSPRGLILDVRGNTGGLIHAGERLLQLLTPRHIEPARFHFLNSVRTLQLTAAHPFIRQWKASIGQAVETGTEFSQGFPLLPVDAYNDIGQKYHGPVVLVTDALCYSTTDIFAAGFQDHRIGTVLGVDANTGAGGANVWEYSLISDLLHDPARFPALPGNASFRFAVRRVTRVGANAGVPLEDLGVLPDARHNLTRKDLLERNVDLITRAAALLSKQPWQRLAARRAGPSVFKVECDNLDQVDAYLDDHPLGVHRVRGQAFSLNLPRGRQASLAKSLRLNGFRQGELVAATRVPLP
jgi:hypothetical protein